MQSYKKWQILNESLFPLGISQRHVVGGIRSNIPGVGSYTTEEKCGCDSHDDDKDMDTHDDDHDDDAEVSDTGDELRFQKKKMSKKNMKKKMDGECGHDDDDDDDMDTHDDDHDSDDDSEDSKEDGDEHPEEYGFQKKNMKKKMGSECKKCGKAKMGKKMGKKMKNEENAAFLRSIAKDYALPKDVTTKNDFEFFRSLQNQFGDPHAKYSDGLQEDFLIPPPGEGEPGKEPGPGEVGYAPVGRIDMFTGNIEENQDYRTLQKYFGDDVAKSIMAKRREAWMQQ